MKWIYLLSSLFLFSCSASYHLEKAKKKGAKIETQIVKEYVTRTDTITDTLTNTKEIRVTIIDTVEKEINSIRYVPLTRQQRKALKDSMDHEIKKQRLELKALTNELNNERRINRDNNRKSNRSEKNAVKMEQAKHFPWWIWFLIGFSTHFSIGFIRKLINHFRLLRSGYK